MGRISKEKNIIFLLETLRDLDIWKFLIVGDGEERARLEKLCEEWGLGERVQWFGWQQEPWKYAEQADALVMASYYEGFPLTAIEAQSRGLPVISTRVDGMEELIAQGVNGYLYDLGDRDSLCHILARVQGQGYVVQHPEQCREHVSEYDSTLVFWDMAVKMYAIKEGIRLRPNTSSHPYYAFREKKPALAIRADGESENELEKIKDFITGI